MGTKLHGIFSIDSIDSSGEIVDLSGVDIYSLPRDGICNFEHKNDLPSQIVGKILYVKKIFSEEDCENEDQLYFYRQVNRPYLYGIVELFDEEGHSEAKNLAAIARYSMKNKDKLFCPVLNFSVEGVTLVKKGQKIQRSVARRVATTVKPCNKQAFAEILGWEDQKKEQSILINISKTEEQRSVFGGHLSVLRKAVDSVKTKGLAKAEDWKDGYAHVTKMDENKWAISVKKSRDDKRQKHVGYFTDKEGWKYLSDKVSDCEGTDFLDDGHHYKLKKLEHSEKSEMKDSDSGLNKAIGRAKTLSSVIKPKRIFTPTNAPQKMRSGDRIVHPQKPKGKPGADIYKDPDTFKNEEIQKVEDFYCPVCGEKMSEGQRHRHSKPIKFNNTTGESLSKALTAGSYDSSPSSLSQGSALQQEDLGGKVEDVGYSKNKNRALAAYRDWRGSKKAKFKEYLKMEMPDVSDDFIKIFSDLVDKVQFKKTEQVMECIFDASLDQFNWENIYKSENNKKGPDFKTLKKNKVKLSEEEREKAIKADAVWHFAGENNPVCAIWKSEVNGKTYYGTNTHRAFNTASTLKGAISKYHSFIKGTA